MGCFKDSIQCSLQTGHWRDTWEHNSGLHSCSFHNGFLLISIHRKCDVSVQFLLPNQRITLRDLLMRSPERECMLWTQYFMGVSWIWVWYALLPHKQCDFEVCQLLLGYCLCLQSAVKTVNFESSQAWCLWECEELRYYGSQHLSCQVKNSEVHSWPLLSYFTGFMWEITFISYCFPVHHLIDAYCMLSSHLLWEDTKLLLQQPEYRVACVWWSRAFLLHLYLREENTKWANTSWYLFCRAECFTHIWSETDGYWVSVQSLQTSRYILDLHNLSERKRGQ